MIFLRAEVGHVYQVYKESQAREQSEENGIRIADTVQKQVRRCIPGVNQEGLMPKHDPQANTARHCQDSGQNEESKVPTLDQDGSYISKEDVSLYLVEYGELPKNFITKKEARSLGWSGGSLEPYAPGKCIGGDRFGNYEGNLPEVEGRTYYECDIDTLGAKSRGPKRIVYSDDGQVYYTEDHYETFTLLYGDDEE